MIFPVQMKSTRIITAMAVAFMMLAVPIIGIADASDATDYKDDEKGVLYESETLSQEQLQIAIPGVANGICETIICELMFFTADFDYSDITLSDIEFKRGESVKVSDGKTVNTDLIELSGKAKFTAVVDPYYIGFDVMDWDQFKESDNVSKLKAFFGTKYTDGYTITFEGEFTYKTGTQREITYQTISGDSVVYDHAIDKMHSTMILKPSKCTLKNGSETKDFAINLDDSKDVEQELKYDYKNVQSPSDITSSTEVDISFGYKFFNCETHTPIDFDLGGDSFTVEYQFYLRDVVHSIAAHCMTSITSINGHLDDITENNLALQMGTTVEKLNACGSFSDSYSDVNKEFNAIGPNTEPPMWAIILGVIIILVILAAIIIAIVLIIRHVRKKTA